MYTSKAFYSSHPLRRPFRIHCYSVTAVSLLLLIMAAREPTCAAVCLKISPAVSSQTHVYVISIHYTWISIVCLNVVCIGYTFTHV